MLLLKTNAQLKGKDLRSTTYAINGIGKTREGVMNDFCRVVGNCVRVEDTVFYDAANTKGAHFDGIQPIPKYNLDRLGSSARIYNAQYALAGIKGLHVEGNFFVSKRGDMQGLLATDGVFEHIEVNSNYFLLRSDHYITFNGLLSGTFKGNYLMTSFGSRDKFKVDWSDKKVPLRLGNARVGGAPRAPGKKKYNNLWILSFKGKGYQEVQVDRTHDLYDTRGEKDYTTNSGVSHEYLKDFDLEGFRGELANRAIANTLPLKTNPLCVEYQKIAREFGTTA